MYFVITLCPAWPSFFSSLSCVVIDVNSVMIIDADMYGMIPKAKTVNRLNAPPENILNIPRMPPLCESKSFLSSIGSIPGTGICAPKRNMTNAPNKNNRRLLSSPIFPSAANVLSCAKIKPL